MSYADFLRSTPPEINIKIEAWNEARHVKAADDYALASLIRVGVGSVFSKETKYPRFEAFYPETANIKPRKDPELEQAKGAAEALGLPTGSF